MSFRDAIAFAGHGSQQFLNLAAARAIAWRPPVPATTATGRDRLAELPPGPTPRRHLPSWR
ncbi:hypothetical protein I546_2373 [Mycobacterium kansasii 732]|uniref:Uncharacterized protein n=1 Tax=Mycobacterium kansasii 662 TaxID=1299326 RepID=X7YWZ7_MYCKA|nr:hypothetical protein I545_5572 [Mycobacterium kansasii 662]EUA12292.1 hypothetical protein I546_2373 [Mycobacterium kansasii 732]